MLIIGIDPSLTATGVALLQVESLIWNVHTIASRPVRSALSTDLAMLKKMNSIRDRIDALMFASDPALVVLEGPAFSKNNGMSHERAGLWWKLYELAADKWECPVVVVKPNVRAMYATGRGNAGKDEVMLAVSRRYPDVPVADNNQCDAVALAAMGARLKDRAVDELPVTHLRAMRTVSL